MKKVIIQGPLNTKVETFDSFHNNTKTVVAEDPSDRMDMSDGYHTIGELYEHRYILWITLCKKFLAHANSIGGKIVEPEKDWSVWRAILHSDGTGFDKYFLLGIGKTAGDQITYHIPMEYWDTTNFAETLEKAPEFDGHTSADVLNRLQNI